MYHYVVKVCPMKSQINDQYMDEWVQTVNR